jgi:hypothetical protein
MNAETHRLADHMRHLGLTMLGHAVHHSIFVDFENLYYNAIGVLHAAQAAEVILKACIASEHPLLIFAKLPKPEHDDQSPLTLAALMVQGRTLQYADLPDVFWAATGFRVPALKTYRRFGELRNTIQHLAVPNEDLAERSLEFLLEVVDPVIQEFWATNIFRHLQSDEEDEFRDILKRWDIPYRGWMPIDHASLPASHPLWLFSPWRHTETEECVWIDEHGGGKPRILRDADYQETFRNNARPIDSTLQWRDIFPPKRLK